MCLRFAIFRVREAYRHVSDAAVWTPKFDTNMLLVLSPCGSFCWRCPKSRSCTMATLVGRRRWLGLDLVAPLSFPDWVNNLIPNILQWSIDRILYIDHYRYTVYIQYIYTSINSMIHPNNFNIYPHVPTDSWFSILEIFAFTVKKLERLGVSGVVIEDKSPGGGFQATNWWHLGSQRWEMWGFPARHGGYPNS